MVASSKRPGMFSTSGLESRALRLTSVTATMVLLHLMLLVWLLIVRLRLFLFFRVALELQSKQIGLRIRRLPLPKVLLAVPGQENTHPELPTHLAENSIE